MNTPSHMDSGGSCRERPLLSPVSVYDGTGERTVEAGAGPPSYERRNDHSKTSKVLFNGPLVSQPVSTFSQTLPLARPKWKLRPERPSRPQKSRRKTPDSPAVEGVY